MKLFKTKKGHTAMAKVCPENNEMGSYEPLPENSFSL